ncbi:putative photosystem I [Helianthus annuus]|nr:putative photosystem I [Helianthus annuus]KAJ0522085.1 putative photosystem I [Helianthus annuus]
MKGQADTIGIAMRRALLGEIERTCITRAAHDFDSRTSDLEEISPKVFSAHFGQLSIIFLWLSGMYFHGARFSNYEAWLSDPTHIGPSAQVVWPIVGQEILNGDASQVIQSYGSSLSAYGLFFLGAHFVWAFSLMFLFSGRGYWQELIESIVWAHNKLKVAPATQPRALSIIQGRAVGVTHYLLGGIATTWAFFLARIIAVG